MKGFLTLIIVVLLSSTGCNSPIDDMLNNKFVTIVPQEMPSNLIGFWTGNMGPYLTSFSFKNDGYGFFCYTYATANVIQKIKYFNNSIHFEDGSKLDIKKFSSSLLVVNANYYFGKETSFYKDQNLKEASLHCMDQLSKK